jgi:drug/metabolite transporter (DMT)-like permease
MVLNLPTFLRKLGGNAYLLLILTTLMWSANGIVGRLAIGEVSPMVIVVLRWLMASILLFSFAHRQIAADWQVLKHHLGLVAFGGVFGFTAFNALFYVAAHYTSGVNMTILQGSLPIFTLIGALIFHRTRISLLGGLGIVMTLAGVVAVASKGDWQTLASLSFNIGDVWLIIACLFYAAFTLTLKNRPKVSGIGFFAILAVAAFIAALPLIGWEMVSGETEWPTMKGWALMAFITLGPSLLAQLFFLRAVELIGPSRASIFTNLVPIFGPIIAILVLGEAFHPYHAVALVLVLGGIGLAEWQRA